MNQEPEVGNGSKVSLSPKERLEDAIREYVDSLEAEPGEDPGILTGWFLVVEQQSPVSGSSSFSKAVRDHQSVATTIGLITYSDEKYRAQIRGC